MIETLRLPYQPPESQPPDEWSSSSRDSSGPRVASSFRTNRLKRGLPRRNSALRRSQAYLPRRLLILAWMSGRSSIG